MKRDFKSIIHTIEGEPYEAEPAKFKKNDKGEVQNDAAGKPIVLEPATPLTLKRVALDALGSTHQGDENMSGEDKYNLYALADRIVKACKEEKPAEIDAKDITTPKNRIAKTWGVYIMGPAFRILDTDYVEQAANHAEPA